MLERQRESIAKAKQEGRYNDRVPTGRRQAAEIIRLKNAGSRATTAAGSRLPVSCRPTAFPVPYFTGIIRCS
jgi:DNA invertase Pin-like site-specific DNA recombinase